jgi:hypothetical protein
VTEEHLVRCLDTLHIRLSRREQSAVFRSFGFDSKGEMPLSTLHARLDQHRQSAARVSTVRCTHARHRGLVLLLFVCLFVASASRGCLLLIALSFLCPAQVAKAVVRLRAYLMGGESIEGGAAMVSSQRSSALGPRTPSRGPLAVANPSTSRRLGAPPGPAPSRARSPGSPTATADGMGPSIAYDQAWQRCRPVKDGRSTLVTLDAINT